jgi:hypothetical protein
MKFINNLLIASILLTPIVTVCSDVTTEKTQEVTTATQEKPQAVQLAHALTKCGLAAAGVGLLALAATVGTYSCGYEHTRKHGWEFGESMLRFYLGYGAFGFGALTSALAAGAPIQSEEKEIANFEVLSKLIGMVGVAGAGAIVGHVLFGGNPAVTAAAVK